MTYSVLIVEDDPMVLSINKRYTKKVSGFEVKATAQSGQEAMDILSTKKKFDLLLIDIHLNNESGLDLVKWIRNNQYDLDYIMITAVSEQEAISLCTQYGAVDYILKPFHFDRFKKSLLRFKYRKTLLTDKNNIKQEDIDNLYWANVHQLEKDEQVLEKGLTNETMQLILSIINTFDDGFTIEELTKKSSLTHVSIRKYVRYLEDQGILDAKQTYGTVGRPTMTYYKSDSNIE